MAEFRAIVAIDFGTANSGGAYSLTADEESSIHYANLDSSSSTQKIPTRIVLRKQPPHDFVAFGPDVLDSYTPGDELIFHSFKMKLYEETVPETIEADVGEGQVPTKVLITRCLEYLSQATLESIALEQTIELSISDVRWVLTVPAIWSEKSKDLMKECARNAGFCHGDDSLILALEPECAALETHETNRQLLQKGARYLVVDCGGGTIDTAAFEVEDELPNLKLKALHRPDGGDWGASVIDDKFMTTICGVFKIPESRRKHNLTLYDFLHSAWMQKKTRIGAGTLRQTARHSFSIGTLIDEFAPGQELATLVDEFNQNYPDFKMESMGTTSLRVLSETMLKIFEPAINNTVSHIQALLSTIPRIEFVVLVGGFAVNRFLQEQIREGIESFNTKLVLARKPSIAIVMGAVSYGLNPNIITIRRSPLTYGIKTTEMCPTGRFESLPNISKQFAQQHRKSHPGGHGFVLKDYFWKMVTINQEVKPGHPFEREFFPASGHNKFKVVLVATTRPDPILTSEPDVREVASLKITVPSLEAVEQRSIIVAVELGTTHITVTATVKATGVSQKSTVDVSYI